MSEVTLSVYQWAEVFPWESEEQRKGFFALIKWLSDLPLEAKDSLEAQLPCIAAWFIQKDHESQMWWSETMGSQIADLQNQIKQLQEDILALKKL